MYLKKLEMKGFKSFADRTMIDFKSGVTCIVGPNGSGKSNIIDAIRWVLGEQKVSLLRGSSMKDVIFNGTEFRKPLGMAEVNLYFDNTENFFPLDFNEIKISRRIYRSGESEYLINNTKTRLKDIKELIMDTGIGTDGYSLIGQGQIDSIISENKDDRRELFEEAAGIVKYKTRKIESERKLERTTDNLDRIEDIVFELKQRVGPLKKQSEKALSYKKLKSELTTIETNLYAWKLKNIDKEAKLIHKKITNQSILLDKKSNYSRILKNKFQALKNRITDNNQMIDRKEDAFYQLNERLNQAKNSLNLNKERSKNMNEKIENVRLEIKTLVENKEELQEKITDNSNKRDALNQTIEQKEQRLDTLTKALENKNQLMDEYSKSNQEYSEKIVELKNQMNNNVNEINATHAIIDEYNGRIDELDNELASFNDLNDQYHNKRDEVVETIVKLNADIHSLTDEKENLMDEKKQLQEKFDKIINQLNEKNSKLTNDQAELNLLKDLENSFKGYYYSVRKLLESCSNNEQLNQGVHGVVASLIHVNKKYELAVEIALGSSMQNVVCDDSSVAKKLIAHLKQNNYGRVSFLPLSNLYDRKDHYPTLNEAKKMDGYIGKADELIDFDDGYNKLFNYLLGNVLIVDNYDHAKEISAVEGLRYKIVTLAGEVFSPGGRITGGSFKSKNQNILSRKRKIKELKKNNTLLKDSIKNLQDEKDRYQQQLKTIEEKIATLTDAIVELKNTLIEQKTIKSNVDEKLQAYDQSVEKITQNKHEINQKINTLKQKIETLQQQNKDHEKQLDHYEHMMKNENDLNDEKQSIETLNQKIMDLKIESASLKEKLEHLLNEKTSIKEELDYIENKINSKQKVLLSFEENNLSLDEKFSDLEDEIAQLSHRKKEMKNTIENLKFKVKHQGNELYAIEDKIEQLNDTINHINSKRHALTVESTKLKVEMKNIIDNLWDKYEISYIDAKNYVVDDALLDNSKKAIQDLKKKINKLGTINLNAIEEYEEVKERYEFLTSQQEDLIEAKESLEGIIRNLERKMKSDFKEKLEEIGIHFNEIFKKLFNGGEAKIVLDEDNDLLESDINIVAQPPGKKLQSIDLLSGGEKALTAISLLFGILKTKPSPFCVLDEIESALDDANVDRFARFLKEFNESSQFIVITHRKGTMEVADLLYGVTMEEQGITKIISLRLEDIEENNRLKEIENV